MPRPTLKWKDWFHPDGFPISVERRDPQEPFGLHAHEFAEIVIITAGRGEHVTGKESYPLNAGDVFVIGGSRQHDYHSMERLCLVNILFQPEKLGLRTYDLRTLPGYHALFTLEPAWRRRHQFNGRLRLTPPELRTVMTFVDSLEAELHTRASGFKFMASATFMQNRRLPVPLLCPGEASRFPRPPAHRRGHQPSGGELSGTHQSRRTGADCVYVEAELHPEFSGGHENVAHRLPRPTARDARGVPAAAH